MKFDMIVSGVGGQGILSISFVVDNAALEDGLTFKQSEVHGMAQRGGAVLSHLRVADGEIFSDLVPSGAADLILSMEPLETLRYVNFLSPEGAVVSSISPFLNIPNYPDLDELIGKLQDIPNHTLVNSAELARAAGSIYAQNIVMLGAASHLMPMENKSMEKFIGVLFKAKGEKIIDINVRAFRAGAMAGAFYRALLDADISLKYAVIIATSLEADNYSVDYATAWKALCEKKDADVMITWLKGRKGLIAADADVPAKLRDMNFTGASDNDFESRLG